MLTFPGYFAKTFGYELVDPFDDICRSLTDRTAFAFSRFGDGEFNAILGAEGANCDGHEYFPDLGQSLRRILSQDPTYLMGLQPLAVMIHGAKQILPFSAGIRWVLADCLQWALVEGRLGKLFDALAEREILLVGPDHLQELARSQGWDHVLVPTRNCWLAYDDTVRSLKGALPGDDRVVLFCASMMSNVLIDDLYSWNPANTYLDLGSILDPCAGVHTRIYHGELEPDVFEGVR